MKHRNNIIIVFVLLLIISIGFSVLSSNLNIIGNSLVKSNSWDIHFENVQVKEGSVNAPTPQINASGNQVTFNITLNTIDDYYEFYVDVVNDGTIDGMIESYTLSQLTNDQLKYLDYKVKYKNGIAVAENQLLRASDSLTYKVYVGYKKDMENSDLPEEDLNNLELSFGVNYVQANNTGIEVDKTTYVFTKNLVDNRVEGNNYIWIDKPLPAGIERFDSGNDINRNVYLKHKLGTDDIVEESYVVFVINDAFKAHLKAVACDGNTECESKYDALVNGEYALRVSTIIDMEKNDCKQEYVDDQGRCISPYYESNLQVLKNAFGTLFNDSSICISEEGGAVCIFEDVSTNFEGFVVNVGRINGYVVVAYKIADRYAWLCHGLENGITYCDEG